MENLNLLRGLERIYDSGSNLMEFMRNNFDVTNNSEETILLSYELQSGSYTTNFQANNLALKKYARQISERIEKYMGNTSIPTVLEVGIGEATTFALVSKNLNLRSDACYGVDISWSRLEYAKKFIEFQGLDPINLMTGNLFQLPFADNSIDIVYTSRCIEPNTGRAREALQELYRVCKKHLLLFELSYELANNEQRKYMSSHGYVKNIYEEAINLGYKVVEHELLDFSINPMNPTAAFIVEKQVNDIRSESLVGDIICCPITKSSLVKYDNVMYSPDSFLMYPIIKDIMCLLPENAIPGYKFLG